MAGSLSIPGLKKEVSWFDPCFKVEDHGDAGTEQHWRDFW